MVVTRFGPPVDARPAIGFGFILVPPPSTTPTPQVMYDFVRP